LSKKSYKDIDAALITHQDLDHMKGTGHIANTTNADIYTSNEVYEELRKRDVIITPNKKKVLTTGVKTTFGDVTVMPFKTSHGKYIDSYYEESHGYLIKNNYHENLVFLTDTGVFPQTIPGAKVYIIEANHSSSFINRKSEEDPMMLERFKRLLSDSGHFSVEDSVDFLNRSMSDETELVIFMHLSPAQKGIIEKYISRHLNKRKAKIVVLDSNKLLTEEFTAGYEPVAVNPF
jgi:phosphoribosyl 1,2-cyclic phosphodiesterase